ncbi:hypothetical protein IIW_00336 [Bacillus cereus VD136]|nr:hypothetical protein IIW_00336 [Bacillus cereus VD136]
MNYAYTIYKQRVISIEEAEKGIDYLCSDCESILRVKQGNIIKKHFFHLNTDDCGGTGESLTHKYWKDKISTWIQITLPTLDGTQEFQIIDAKQEVSFLDRKYIADIVLTIECNGNPYEIIVEVCYKNHKDSSYVDYWTEIGKPVFEFVVTPEGILNRELLWSKQKEKREREKFLKSLPYSVGDIIQVTSWEDGYWGEASGFEIVGDCMSGYNVWVTATGGTTKNGSWGEMHNCWKKLDKIQLFKDIIHSYKNEIIPSWKNKRTRKEYEKENGASNTDQIGIFVGEKYVGLPMRLNEVEHCLYRLKQDGYEMFKVHLPARTEQALKQRIELEGQYQGHVFPRLR